MCIQKANRVNFDLLSENIIKKEIIYCNFDVLCRSVSIAVYTTMGCIAYTV